MYEIVLSLQEKSIRKSITFLRGERYRSVYQELCIVSYTHRFIYNHRYKIIKERKDMKS